LINSQKFIWETYKILLDFTKTNSKLLSLYSQILKAAFNFCKENKRKVEFKRLCDSVRGYLQTLIKTEKKQHFQNKVQISRPEVLKILIQIRINLLDTATELEQWQEAFKTAEDIIFLMDKYEKQTSDEALAISKKQGGKSEKVKKSTKIPPMMKLEFYSNIMKLLWISDYHLYHAHAVIVLREIGFKVEKLLKSSEEKGNQEKIKELKGKLEKHDFYQINDMIVLSALVTPFKNSYTNYVTKGDEFYENDKEIEAQTCHRMMGILKLHVVPSRKNLISFIETNNILSECNINIRTLYELLEKETNPIQIAKKSASLIELLKSNSTYERFSSLISKNLIIKCVMQMSTLYDSVSFSRLQNIFRWESFDNLEEVISEQTRIKVLDCTIDHSKNLIIFKNNESLKRSFDEKMSKLLNSVEKLCVEIMSSDLTKDQKKFALIKSAISQEVYSHNSNSLAIYDNLINQINSTNKKLEEFYQKKQTFKYEQREKRSKEVVEQKQKAEEEAKMMKDIMKDKQKEKELDIQLKKYLIERIKVYTNVIMQGSKKFKLEDLLKDLSKTTVEDLIKILENEEINFKSKKEIKFKEISRNTDYTLREFRSRDFEVLKKNLENDERIYNEIREKEHKINYEGKIGFKANLVKVKEHKDKFFNQILSQREAEYKERMAIFTQNLEKVVFDEILKDVSNHFKPYIADLRSREEEQRKKLSYQTGSFIKTQNREFAKGQNFVNFEDRPRGPTEFASKFFNL
jgi:translation initiation factor 3 subunit A